jgi:Fanconi anemia group M protein
MSSTEIDIIIDTREQHKEYFAEKLREKGWTIRIRKLEVGDFMILADTPENTYLIERKDDSDFINSLQGEKDLATGMWERGRIWSQVKRMNQSFDGQKRILIEGNPYSSRLTAYRKNGMNRERIWGALEGIRKWNVFDHRTKNRLETIDYLHYLIQRTNRPKKEYSLRPSAKSDMSLEEQKRYFIEGLPGIGPKAAKAILEAYPQSLLDAIKDAENWDKLRGIGKVGKRRIIEVLWTRNDRS